MRRSRTGFQLAVLIFAIAVFGQQSVSGGRSPTDILAKWTRAGSYDLAGTGLNEPGTMRRTSVRIAEELRTALHQAGVGGPYILVGSAFGGDNLRTFADLYMDEGCLSLRAAT
jgi:hypothetical protein